MLTKKSNGRLHPLIRASLQNGDFRRVEDYVSGGGDLNATDLRGRTPLILAAARGRDAICRFLLDSGADAKALDIDGLSASDSARRAGFDSIAEMIDGVSNHPAVQDAREEAVHPDVEIPGEWHAEDEVEAPVDDPAVKLDALRLQKGISEHPVRNTDAAWDDLRIDLPRGLLIDTDLASQPGDVASIFSTLITSSVEEGQFNADLIDATSSELGYPEDPEMVRRLMQVMQDYGAVPVDGESEWLSDREGRGSEVDAWNIQQGWDHLQDLLSPMNDPQFHLATEVERSVLLDREGEERIGKLLSLSMVSASLAIAADPNALDVVAQLAEEVSRDPGFAKGICHVGGDDEDSTTDSVADTLIGRIAEVVNARTDDTGARQTRLQAALDQLQITLRGAELVLERLEAGGFSNADLEEAITRGRRVQRELFSANLRLAISVAKTYWWSELPEMDRIQEAFLGLLTAVERFDVGRGFKFSTYATWWLRHAVSRAHADKARLIRIPVHALDKLNKISAAAREGNYDSARDAPPDYLVGATGLAVEDIEKLLSAPDDALPWASSDDVLNEVMCLKSELEGPEDFVERLDREAALDLDILELPGNQGPVLRHRFGLDDGVEMTLEEVGRMFGVTRERIRQIESMALARLRHPERRVAEYRWTQYLRGDGE